MNKPLIAYSAETQTWVRGNAASILRNIPGIAPHEVDASVLAHYDNFRSQPAPFAVLLPLVQREVAASIQEAIDMAAALGR